ncbi:MAG: proton-conducting transporter membrane subunit [Candidatus Methanofastidiosa archaeon]|nr:proton-conducting transporter membrane subunit [Candidatus Methanofastidiosa archaeon]
MNSELIPLMVVFPLISAILLNLMHGKDRVVRVYGTLAMVVVIAVPLLAVYGNHLFGAHPAIDTPAETGIALGRINLAIEYSFGFLQRALIFLLAAIATFAVLSHTSNEKRASGVYLSMVMLSIAAVSAVVMANDIFNMFVFLEILTISQAAMVVAKGDIGGYKAALKYLIFGGVAGGAILLGIALLLGTFGVLNITDLGNALSGNTKSPIVLTAVGLLVIGWLFESGLFPFHTIKSHIYSSAKADVAALLQTETKIVLVAIAIILLRLFGGLSNMSAVMVGLSVITLAFGSVMALVQTDFRRLLAFAAVGQAGLVGIGLSLGTPDGIAASIFHAVNDALAMSLLFVTVFVIYEGAKTTEFSRLGGLLAKAPRLAFLQIIGIMAVSGVPPFNAYQSEYRLIGAAFQAGYPELGVVIILGTIVTFVALMKGFFLTFLKESTVVAAIGRPQLSNALPLVTFATMVILALVCLGIGLHPGPLYDRFADVAITLTMGV